MQPKTRTLNSARSSSKPKQPLRRLGWLHVVVFCVVLVGSWFVWGKGMLFGSIDVIIHPSIDQTDERIDYNVVRSVIGGINDHFYVPNKLNILIEPCGDANAYYDTSTHDIVLCDELIDDFVSSFQRVYDNPIDVRDASTNAFVFIAVHELGHALIHVLDIPITGKEEDVADQLSVYMLINSFEDGAQFVLDSATWFGVASEQYELEEGDFADVHSLDVQRYYTLACWVYGADPVRYGEAVLEGGLPPDRAKTCQDEYQMFSRSWDVLLKESIR